MSVLARNTSQPTSRANYLAKRNYILYIYIYAYIRLGPPAVCGPLPQKDTEIDDADATLMNIEESLQVATSIHPSPRLTVTETAVMKINKHNGLIQRGIMWPVVSSIEEIAT